MAEASGIEGAPASGAELASAPESLVAFEGDIPSVSDEDDEPAEQAARALEKRSASTEAHAAAPCSAGFVVRTPNA
jgi:hypothetical protein